MTNTLNDEKIEKIARAIAAARELCGNERAAMLEAFSDEGIKPRLSDIDRVQYRAAELWRSRQREAGVDPKYYVC